LVLGDIIPVNTDDRGVSHYAITGCLRADRLLSIYEADDLNTHQCVWLHILLPGRKVSELFQAECGAFFKQVSKLNHQNLLPVIDHGIDSGTCYYITPAVSALPIELPHGQSLNEQHAAAILVQVCQALTYLHDNNTAHGNLSPENILCFETGEVLLTGYGVMEFINRELARSSPEKMMSLGGTSMSYIAPERLEGRSPGAPADLYSLGAVYYRLVTGLEPYHSASWVEQALLRRVMPLYWPKQGANTISRFTFQFIRRCMQREPDRRFHSLREAGKQLARIASGRYLRVPRLPSPAWVASLLLAILLMALAAGAAFGLFTTPPQSVSQPPPLSTDPIDSVTPEPPPTAAAVNAVTFTPTELQHTKTATPPATIVPTLPQPTYHLPVFAGTRIPGEAQKIAAANLDRVQQVSLLGFGRLHQVAQKQGDDIFAVASAAGVYIFTINEVSSYIDVGDAATSVQFSANGEVLAVGLMKGDIQLWDWQAGQKIGTLVGQRGRVNRILFSPNRRFLISGGEDLYIHIWDLNQMEQFKSMPAHEFPIQDMAITADGFFLASCDGKTSVLKLWNLNKYSKIIEIDHESPVHAVAFSPEGRYVAAGGYNGKINQWNVDTHLPSFDSISTHSVIWDLYYDKTGANIYAGLDGGQVQRLNSRNRGNWRQAFQPTEVPKRLLEKYGATFDFSSNTAINLEDGSYVSINWDGTIRMSNKRSLLVNSTYDDFKVLYFSPNSQYLLAGGVRDSAYLWDLAENHFLGDRPAIPPQGMPFTETSEEFVLITQKTIKPKKSGQAGLKVEALQIFTSATFDLGKQLTEFPRNAYVDYVMDDRLLAANTSNEAKIWDTASHLEILDQEEVFSGCRLVRSLNNHDILSIYSPLGILHDWDERTRRICALPYMVWGRLADVSHDRHLVAFINTAGQLEVLDLDQNQAVWRQSSQYPITALDFSPDGTLIAAGSNNGAIVIWDVTSGIPTHTLWGHYDAIRAVIFSPDGKSIASASRDGTVRIWRAIQ
jgi:WD40 repeat protein/serine/threonine protein kinase